MKKQYRIKGYILLEANTDKDIMSLRELFAGTMDSFRSFNKLKYKKDRKISYSFEPMKNGKSAEWPYHKFMVGNKQTKERKIK